MVLVLAVVPAVSLACQNGWPGWPPSPKCNVTLSASRHCITAGSSVKLTAKARPCPAGATFALQTKGSAGWTTLTTSPAGKCGTAVFQVTPTCTTCYQVVLTWSNGGSATSNPVCVKVMPKLTLTVTPPTYGSGIGISGTLVPAGTGNVCITISQVLHCWRVVQVAKLSVPLTQGPGNSSVFATSWAGASGNSTYVITARVNGACAIQVIKT